MTDYELPATAALDDVLAGLESGGLPEDDAFAALSDLSRSEIQVVRNHWESIPAPTREAVLTRAGELAEERIDLDFTAFARIGLRDPDPAVRISALEAAGDTTNVAFGLQTAGVLANDPDEGVRTAAAAVLRQFVLAHALGQLNASAGDEIIARLRARLEDPAEDELVRALALEALGPDASPWLSGAIEEAYASDLRERRLAALRVMGDSCDDEWLDYLFAQMEANDPEFRYEAAVAAGAIGSTDAVEPVASLLADDDPRVVLAAIEALGEIGGSAALEELRAFAPHAPEGTETSVDDAITMARETAALEEDADDEDNAE